MSNDQKFPILLALALAADGCAHKPMSDVTLHRVGEDWQRGEVTSGWLVRKPFDSAVLSLDIEREVGVVDLMLRVRRPGGWESRWFDIAQYPLGSRSESPTDGVSFDVDVLRCSPPANAIQYRLCNRMGNPLIQEVMVVTYCRSERKPFAASRSPAWGKVLSVPQRSQKVEAPEIRGEICSPTSVAMALDYFHVELPTAEVARGVYDGGAKIYGNWPLNTAFATSALRSRRIKSFVDRFASMEELEEEIISARPVIISLRWAKGELTDAVVPSSDGHLLVVVGFTGNGDVVVNDPAADPAKAESIRRIYLRRDIYRCWLENAEGIVYLFRPRK